MARLLLVEDDPTMREIMKLYFEKSHEVSLAEDGISAVKLMNEEFFDIIILDLMLPKLSGNSVAQVANAKGIPVIMVTAKNSENDILNGLKLGAIDYVTKPFSPKVLLAKVENFLKRFSTKPKFPTIDVFSRTLITKDARVALSPTETSLLSEMMKEPGKAFRRKELMSLVWGEQRVSERTVDATVKNLRKKLKNTGVEIRTIVGVGYTVEIK